MDLELRRLAELPVRRNSSARSKAANGGTGKAEVDF
jgi:hypothetical protein